MRSWRSGLLSSFILFASFAGPMPVLAEPLSGVIFSGAYRAFSGDTCANPATMADPDCAGLAGANAVAQLSAIGQTKIYQDLASLQNERLKCGIQKQESLLNSPAAMTAAKDRINRTLPVLSALKKEIGAIVAQNQLLRGKIPQNKITNPDPYEKLRHEYESQNNLAKVLTAEYERQLAALLQTEDVGNREFIEDRLSGITSSVKLLSDNDFKELQKKVMDSLQTDSKAFEVGASNFSNKQRNSLSQDPDLIGLYLSKNPASRVGVERLQCEAHQRIEGERGVDTALTVGSLALPVGAFALARAARVAYVARIPGAASAFTKAGKGFGWLAIGIGSAQTAKEMHDGCSSAGANAVKGSENSCSVSAAAILDEEKEFSCISSALWTASPVLGGYALKLLAKVSKDLKNLPQHQRDLAKFVEDHKSDMRRRDLATVDRLLENDVDRVRVTEQILGRKKPFTTKEREGFLAAHNVGKPKNIDGELKYSDAEIAEKKRLLTEAGFGWRERTIMLHKGLAGRFAGLSDEARTAEIKAFDRIYIGNVKDLGAHRHLEAQIELIRDNPNPEKFRLALSKAIAARRDAYWRAGSASASKELLRDMSLDYALLGSVSRGNAKAFALARSNYADVIKLRMRQIEKEGRNPKEWLAARLAEKKASEAVGPLAEMEKFEVEVLDDLVKMAEKEPKFFATSLDQNSFREAKFNEAFAEAKADIEKAVKEGPPVVDKDASQSVASAGGATPPKPVPGSTFKPIQYEKPENFARRQKLAGEYQSWSGGSELTDAQSQYLAWGHSNFTDSGGFGGLQRMQKMGFDTREARMLQFNDFEVGVNKKFSVAKLPDDLVKRAEANFVNTPEWTKPANLSKPDAERIINSAPGGNYYQTLKETRINAEFLDGKAASALNPKELDQHIAGRNAYAKHCRKMVEVLLTARPTDALVPEWKALVTTGPCRY